MGVSDKAQSSGRDTENGTGREMGIRWEQHKRARGNAGMATQSDASQEKAIFFPCLHPTTGKEAVTFDVPFPAHTEPLG